MQTRSAKLELAAAGAAWMSSKSDASTGPKENAQRARITAWFTATRKCEGGIREQVGMTGISRRVEKTGTEARTKAEAEALDDGREATRDLTTPEMTIDTDGTEIVEGTATGIAIVTTVIETRIVIGA